MISRTRGYLLSERRLSSLTRQNFSDSLSLHVKEAISYRDSIRRFASLAVSWRLAPKSEFLLALVPTLYFIAVTAPHWGEPGSLDAMICFRESIHWFQGGIGELARARGGNLHPPLLCMVQALAFSITGPSTGSVNALGAVLILLGSLTTFFLVRRAYSTRAAFFSSVLLFANPLVIVHNFYGDGADALLLPLLLMVIAFCTLKNYLLLGAVLSLSVLAKETAWIFPVICLGFLLLDARSQKKVSVRAILCLLLPLLSILAWHLVLRNVGGAEWDDNAVLEDTSLSPFEIVINYLTHLKVFNTYLRENLENIWMMNFAWVQTSLCLVLAMLIPARTWLATPFQRRMLTVLISFTFFYALLSLSFPTWTEMRYGLPVLPLLLIPLGILVSLISSFRLGNLLFVALFLIMVVGNFWSADPVTQRYGLRTSYRQSLYALDNEHRGSDGQLYNLQFVSVMARQNEELRSAFVHNADFIVADCRLWKLGEFLETIGDNPGFYTSLRPGKKLGCVMNSRSEVWKWAAQHPTKIFYVNAQQPPSGPPLEFPAHLIVVRGSASQ